MFGLTASRWFPKSRLNRQSRRARSIIPTRLHIATLEDRVVPALAFTETFESYAGAGFAPTPAAGQLSSNAWATTGMSDGSSAFGDTKVTTNTDFTRGTSAAAVTSGGFYAFTTASTKTFGVQPTGSDWATNATVTLKVQNDSVAASDPVIGYDIFVRPDQARSSQLNFAYSLDGSTFVPVASLDYTTPVAAVAGAPYASIGNKTATLTGVNLAANAFLYLRWIGGDVAGTGSRDEYGFDNVTVTAGGNTGGNVAPSGVGPTFAYVNSAAASSVTVAALGSPAPTFSIVNSTVPGATINSTTGVLSFTAPTIFTPTGFTVEVKASNASGDATQIITIVDLPTGAKQAFTPGNLLVNRVGDGVTTFGTNGFGGSSNVAGRVYLDEYTTAGVLVQSVPLPTADSGNNKSVTLGFASPSEGALNLSADGHSVTFGGYSSAPGSSNPTNASSTAVNRVFGSVNPDGSVVSSTRTSADYSSNSLRSVATVDGKQYWAAGSTGKAAVRFFNTVGLLYDGSTNASVAVSTPDTVTTANNVIFSNGRLYWDARADGIFTEQDAIPLAQNGTASTLITSGADLYGFTLVDMDANGGLNAGDRLYFVTTTGTVGDLFRSDYDGTSWQSAASVANNFGDVYHITAQRIDATKAAVYGTRTNSSVAATTTFSTGIVTLTDDGSAGQVWTELANFNGMGTAAALRSNRGISFVPQAAGAKASTVTVISSANPANSGDTVTITATVSGTGGTPSGYVSFLDASNRTLAVSKLDVSGQASFSKAFILPASITAYYGGDFVFSSGSGNVAQAITGVAAPVITSPNTTTIGAAQNGSFVVVATGTPTPTFTLTAGPSWVSIDSSGKLSYTAPPSTIAPADYSFTITAKNGVNPDATQNFKLSVTTFVPAPFTAGNLVIYRVGDGSTRTYGSSGTGGVTSASSAGIYFDEYTPSGSYVQTVEAPTTVSASISGSTDGLTSLSADGRLLAFGGFNAPIGTPAVAATITSGAGAVPRIFGTVNSAGVVGNLTSTTAYDGGTLRSATTVNGKQFWTGGAPSGTGTAANAGVRYYDTVGAVNAPGQIINNSFNARGVAIFNGRLYWDTGSTFGSGTGVYNTITADLPTTAGGAANDKNILPAPSPYQFTLIDMDNDQTLSVSDRLYVVDDSGMNGLSRADYNGTGWTYVGVIPTNLTDLRGLTGVRVDFDTVALYATRASNNIAANTTFSTSLVTTEDTDGLATLTWTDLVTFNGSGANAAVRQFRGVTFVPEAVGATATSVTIVSSSPSAAFGAPVEFTATVNGGTPNDFVTILNGSKTLFTGALDASGQAKFTTSTLPLGTATLTAFFGGNDSRSSASGTVNQTITGSGTTVTIGSNQANPTVGTAVTFTVTVASTGGTPTGTVDLFSNSFKLNATPVTLDASGKGTVTVTATANQTGGNLNPGIDHLTAIYTPTGNFVTSAGEFAQKVQPNAFTVGNVLVYRTGDGANALTPNGNRIYIDEYLPGAGQTDPVQSIILPTIATGLNKPVLASGTQSTDAQLTISPDGTYAYFPAYNAGPTNTSNLTSASATSIPRVIGRINLVTREIETSMTVTDAAANGLFRGITVTASGSIYTASSTGGVSYFPAYSATPPAATTIVASGFSWVGLHTFGSTPQLFGSTLSNGAGTAPKVATIGSGLPIGTATVTAFPGIPLANTEVPKFPVDFYLADLNATVESAPGLGIDTLYISENGASFTGGTITKWAWTVADSKWTKLDTINPPNAVGTPVDNTFYWLSGKTIGGTVTLFATNGSGGTNTGGGSVWSVVDAAGYNQAFTTTTLTTVAQQQVGSLKTYRGIAEIPAAGTATPTVVGYTVNTSPQRSRLTTITVTFSGVVDAAQFQDAGEVVLTRTVATPSETVGTVVDVSSGLIVSQGSPTTLVLTFNLGLNSSGIDFGSLADGIWKLNLSSGATPIYDSVSAGGPQIRRLFGDINNDGTVEGGADFSAFGSSFGLSTGDPGFVAAFDFNNDGTVEGGVDFSEFGTRFGLSL